MLKWRLGAALDRPPLTAAQLKTRQQQRDWLRERIRKLNDSPAMKAEGAPTREKSWRTELDERLFDAPLLPMFYLPMSAEKFQAFKEALSAQEESEAAWATTRPIETYFSVGLEVLGDEMLATWPLEFARGATLGDSPESLMFRPPLYRPESLVFLSAPANKQSLKVEIDRLPIFRGDAPLGARGDRKKVGDLWLDNRNQKIRVDQNAKLLLLDDPLWEIDRLPLAELRKRLQESKVSSVDVKRLRPQKIQRAPAQGADADRETNDEPTTPTLVVQSRSGKICVLSASRVSISDARSYVQLRASARPLPPCPPFHAGDEPEAKKDVQDTKK